MKIKIFKDFIGDGFDTVNLENEINNFIKNKKVIEEYIRNQIYEDKMYDQMSMKEFVDPFTGEKIK